MNPISLVKWSYTSREWRQFYYWKAGNQNILMQIYSFFRALWIKKNTEVKITSNNVWVNNSPEPFQNSTRRLREIIIREEGKINVMEICYDHGNKAGAITIPVPKGKLREAIEVQEYFRVGTASV